MSVVNSMVGKRSLFLLNCYLNKKIQGGKPFISLLHCMRTTSNLLPPEFKKAFKVFSKTLKSVDNGIIPTGKLTKEVWSQSGNLVHVDKRPRIREIPSGNGWRWNQAKKRYTVTCEVNGNPVEIMKLVPRKTVNTPLIKLPKLKIFQLCDEITSFTTFWCEKGADSDPTLDLDVSDYSFLAEFMNPSEAIDIWPELCLDFELESPISTSPSPKDQLDTSNYLPFTQFNPDWNALNLFG